MTKKHIYHYHCRSSNSGTETTIDGIAQLENRIANHEDYRKLKDLITEEEESYRRWEITSLSYLGTTE